MRIDRSAFLFEVETRLKQWEATIAGLQQEPAVPVSELSVRIASLVHKRNTLRNKVERLRHASDREWGRTAREVLEAAREVETAWACLVTSMSRSPTMVGEVGKDDTGEDKAREGR